MKVLADPFNRLNLWLFPFPFYFFQIHQLKSKFCKHRSRFVDDWGIQQMDIIYETIEAVSKEGLA